MDKGTTAESSWAGDTFLGTGPIFRGLQNYAVQHGVEIQNKKKNGVRGGISAYNAGIRNVKTYSKMDIGTTGNDYANDVVARAKFYKRNGY
ncbi:unnamed protein product [Eretmochelys imbricata]